MLNRGCNAALSNAMAAHLEALGTISAEVGETIRHRQ